MWFTIAAGAVTAFLAFKIIKRATRAKFGPHTTALQALEGADISRHVIAITGPSAGIGVETARVLLGQGATVLLLARDLPKLNKVVDKMGLTSDQRGRAIVVECDLGSLASVRTAAGKIKSFLESKNVKLNTVINNAGISANSWQTSKDGFESDFATNHLGHYYLNTLLAPLMGPVPTSSSSSGLREPRVIVLASDVQRLFWPRFKIKLQDVVRDGLKHLEEKDNEQALLASGQPFKGKFNGISQYCFTKALNVIYARHLNRVLQERGIKVVSVHPGFIKTELVRDQIFFLTLFVDFMRNLLGLFWDNVKTISQGAATSVRCVALPDSELKGGHFYQDCVDANDWGVFSDLREGSYSREDEEALFKWSEALVTRKGFPLKL